MELPSAPMATLEYNTLVVPAGTVAEPKEDGYRALVARWDDGRVLIRSRHGTDLTRAFPEIAEAAAQLPDAVGSILLDGELVVWESGRLAFPRLGKRLNAKPATVRRIRAEFPAHFIAFDILHIGDRGSLVREPYQARRAVLEKLFKRYKITSPWQLCPATTNPDTIREWLTAGVENLGYEGIVWKAPLDPYRPGVRGWQRYKIHTTTEAVIGAVTGRITQPQSLFLGRLDRDGQLRYVGRSTPLKTPAAIELGTVLSPAAPGHPWTGRRFTAAWGSSATISPTLVEPRTVAEISVDAAKDGGVYRHQVKYVRMRMELQPEQAPKYDDT